MRSHFVPACCIINNKGERTLFHCVLLCEGHETRDKVSYLIHKIERPLTARGGGWSRPLRTRPLRMQVFDLTCSVVFPAKLSRDAVANGGRITRNPAYPGWYRISYPTSIFDMPQDFLPVPLPLRVQRKDVRLADVAARAEIKAESAVKAALAMGQREKLNNLPINFSLFFLFLAKNKIIFEKNILFCRFFVKVFFSSPKFLIFSRGI